MPGEDVTSQHEFVFCNSSKGLCDCGEPRNAAVHRPEPEVSVWDRMSHAELLADAKRQHADKLAAELKVEQLQRSLRKAHNNADVLRRKLNAYKETHHYT